MSSFYVSCIKNSTINPGFVAEKVQMAGNSIDGLGYIFTWAGDMFTKYGFSGGMLSVFAFAVGKVAEFRGGGDATTKLATTRLKETGGAFLIGSGLAAIGGPVSFAGRTMASRETQCRIGNALDFDLYKQREL